MVLHKSRAIMGIYMVACFFFLQIFVAAQAFAGVAKMPPNWRQYTRDRWKQFNRNPQTVPPVIQTELPSVTNPSGTSPGENNSASGPNTENTENPTTSQPTTPTGPSTSGRTTPQRGSGGIIFWVILLLAIVGVSLAFLAWRRRQTV